MMLFTPMYLLLAPGQIVAFVIIFPNTSYLALPLMSGRSSFRGLLNPLYMLGGPLFSSWALAICAILVAVGLWRLRAWSRVGVLVLAAIGAVSEQRLQARACKRCACGVDIHCSRGGNEFNSRYLLFHKCLCYTDRVRGDLLCSGSSCGAPEFTCLLAYFACLVPGGIIKGS